MSVTRIACYNAGFVDHSIGTSRCETSAWH